jgi:NagD protein
VLDFPYRPTLVVDSIADVVPYVDQMCLPEDGWIQA